MSKTAEKPNPGTTDDEAAGPRLLVVIDHHEARVFRSEDRGAVPEKLTPYDPHGYGRHLHASHDWSAGAHPAERKQYHEAVARTLRGADQILLFGCGTGRSCAMAQLLDDLKAHHPDVAGRVIGAQVVDMRHTTENELLARARAIFDEYTPA